MSTSQRVGRGFHRLALLLAAVALLVGVAAVWQSVSPCPTSERLWKGSCHGPVAINEATGQVVILDGNEWVPYSRWTEFLSYGFGDLAEVLAITLAGRISVASQCVC